MDHPTAEDPPTLLGTTPDRSRSAALGSAPSPRVRSVVGLCLLALAFLAAHLPVMFRSRAGQDEDWYAVPGVTILRYGLPKIPYIPAQDPGSACYRADVALYALPPLGFYLQAPVHALLGEGLGAARFTSTLAGLAAAALVYNLARLWLADGRGALFAACAFLFSRALLFPATTARPDMAAVTFGLLAIRWAILDRLEPASRRPIAAGASAGLSLLTHPFGVVPTVHAGLSFLTGAGDRWRRLRASFGFSAAALGVFALWLPLIALHPDVFRHQFGANVLHRAGPGLGRTLLAPWEVLIYQARQFSTFVGPLQSGLYVLGLAWCLLRARRDPSFRPLSAHLLLSIGLLAIIEGQHPTLGYYAYSVAFLSIAVGGLFATIGSQWDRFAAARFPCLPALGGPIAAALLLMALLPGAGLRPGLAHLRHWNDPAYDAHALARTIMADLPPEAVVAVDGGYVLDFYLAGRRALDATIHPLSYDVRTQPFDYAILGPAGLKLYRPSMTDLVLLKTYGSPDDPFASYAELYRRQPPDGGARR